MSEEWRPVSGFEAQYEVSSLGSVRRTGKAARNGKGRGGGARIGRPLTPQPRRGYLAVQLWKDGKLTNFLLHRLVAIEFIGPIPEGKEVNHKDGVKSNCAASNLEYMTHSENMDHAYRAGLRFPCPHPSGETHHSAKLTRVDAGEIRRRYKPKVCTLKMLAREYGVDHKTIHAVITGKTWRESV